MTTRQPITEEETPAGPSLPIEAQRIQAIHLMLELCLLIDNPDALTPEEKQDKLVLVEALNEEYGLGIPTLELEE